MAGSSHAAVRWAILLLLPIAFGRAADAQSPEPPDNVEYDIVRHHDSLTVWLNLARYFDEREFRTLGEGIDYVFDISIRLTLPRKLWGSDHAASAKSQIRLSYQLAGRNFRLLFPVSDPATIERLFLDQNDVQSFLADSILIPVAPLDSLHANRSYRIDLDVSRISLTFINLAEGDLSSPESSPIKSLFREFLKITDYGRENWSTSSRSFRLIEVGPLH